jgi:predicted CXXCH cytochrome family protein
VVAAVLGGFAALLAGCSATTRHRVLTAVFDGVPPLRSAESGDAAPGHQAGAAPASIVAPRAHGPYAAKLCDACHVPQSGNTLAGSPQQLCLRCHQFRFDGLYVHGPLAAGGCRACHEPHSSPNRYLLVSESEQFCFRCHDRERLRGHAGDEPKCTSCHDAHMSTKKFLLR